MIKSTLDCTDKSLSTSKGWVYQKHCKPKLIVKTVGNCFTIN